MDIRSFIFCWCDKSVLGDGAGWERNLMGCMRGGVGACVERGGRCWGSWRGTSWTRGGWGGDKVLPRERRGGWREGTGEAGVCGYDGFRMGRGGKFDEREPSYPDPEIPSHIGRSYSFFVKRSYRSFGFWMCVMAIAIFVLKRSYRCTWKHQCVLLQL